MPGRINRASGVPDFLDPRLGGDDA